MNQHDRIAVTSRSFSKHPVLRQELLSRYGQVTFNEQGTSLKGQALVEFLKGHDRAIVALEEVTDEVLGELPGLKVISKYGVGIDKIDVKSLARRQVKLGWTPGVNKRSVAELTLSLMIACLRKVVFANRQVLAGTWQQVMGLQLTGKTVGIIGCGNVGEDLIRLLAPFHCTILIHDIVDKTEICSLHGAQQLGLDELLKLSDIVSIHVPLEKSTHNLLSLEKLRLMRWGAVLINLARGGIADESAVRELLESGHLRSAAFDVFANEPPMDVALISHPNFIVTPHIGGSAEEAVLAMGRAAIEGLEQAEVPRWN